MNDTVSKIARDFKELAAANPTLAAMLKKLNSGKAEYLDADRYALELATVLGKALHVNLGGEKLTGDEYQAVIREALPKGLYSIYEDVADYAQTIQQGINERQKVGLKAVKPEFNQDESDAITGKAASANSYDEIPGGINQDMQHMSQNVATDTMKANAKLANDVGMEATVTRIYDGVGVHTQGTGKYKKECSWCLVRCGTDVPYSKAIANDMFRRHPGCGCKISYTVNGKTQVQNDWRKNQWEDQEEGHRGKNRNTEIATSTINSPDYSRRLSSVDSDRKVSEVAILEGRKMLRHRSGTLFEDLTFVDTRTGEFITRTDYDHIRSVLPSSRMRKMVNDAPDYTIVAIHNHPESTAPSPGDIHVLHARRNAYGVVLGHDGSIWKYSIRPDKFNEAAYSSAFAKLDKAGYNNDSVKQFIEDAKANGVDIEVL